MKLGFSPLTAGLDYPQSFDLAAELGLFLELAYDQHEIDPRLPKAQEVLEMGRAAGVGFTVHLPFIDWNLASLVPSIYKLSLQRTQQAIDFGAEIGASIGVLHTGLIAIRLPLALEHAHYRLGDALGKLQLHIPVALENLGLNGHDLLETPDELVYLLERYPQYSFCQDVAHALLQRGPDGNVEYHHLLQHRLTHWHLCDTPGDWDAHMPCGDGMVDWEWVRTKLAGFEGTVALEVTGGQQGVRRSLELIKAGGGRLEAGS